MIKAKLSFFWTSNLDGHGSHGNKGTLLYPQNFIFLCNQLSISKVIDI